MPNADPTILSLELLEDPNKFVKVEAVPIFKEHKRKRKDGREEVVDKTRLAAIAARMNRTAEKHGVLAKLSDGHTIQENKLPQKDQPRVFGWAGKARIGRWGPKKELGLLTDFYYAKDTFDVLDDKGMQVGAKGYPFRSPEFVPDTNEITTIALLKTEPMLDMGMTVFDPTKTSTAYSRAIEGEMFLYERGDGTVYTFFSENEMAQPTVNGQPPPPRLDYAGDGPTHIKQEHAHPGEPTIGGIGDASEQDMPDKTFHEHFMKSLHHVAKTSPNHAAALGVKVEGPEGAPVLDGKDGHIDPEFHEHFMRSLNHHIKHNAPMGGTSPMVAPSASSGHIPDGKEKHNYGAGEDVGKAAGTALGGAVGGPVGAAAGGAIGGAAGANLDAPKEDYGRKLGEVMAYAKTLEGGMKAYEKRIADLEAKNADQTMKYQKSEAEKLVNELKGQGYRFNYEKEVIKLSNMPTDEARQERVAEIRENYQRDPAAAPDLGLYIAGNGSEGGNGTVQYSMAQADEVINYCRDHPGIKWEDAEKKVQELKGMGRWTSR